MFCGRYEIIKPLEKGSGGTVYLVKDFFMLKKREGETELSVKIDFEHLDLQNQAQKALKIYKGI